MRNQNLLKILDSLDDTGVYVIKKENRTLLYYNQTVKNLRPDIVLGMTCRQVFPDGDEYCPCRIIRYSEIMGQMVTISVREIQWDDEIPACMITLNPHTWGNEEKQGIEQIEKMYMQSLVTVFGECIIANLTKDFYVNCQKDMLWTDIPERGQFGIENKNYSAKTIHPDDWQDFDDHFSRDAMLRIFGEGRRRIIRRLRRLMDDGVYHMVEFMAVRIDQLANNECWCVLVFRDIQEEYQQEVEKNTEISQLATAARLAFQMLISANLTKNTYHMLEYDEFSVKKAAPSGNFDELMEVEVSTLDPDFREEFRRKFSRDALLKAFAQGQNSVTMEMRQLGDDGCYHWNSTQVVKVDSPYTDDVLEITLSKNIDEERQKQEEFLEKERKSKLMMEEALQKAESANRAKSNFLSRMSHDIRTPMNAIMGMTALAQININDKEKLIEYLEKIEISSNHLLKLINEVLDMSRIESGKMQLDETEFDLCGLVQEVVLMMQPAIQQNAQKLIVEIPDDFHSLVLGDEQRLRQILINILENAVKYTGFRGKIRVRLEELTKDEAYMGTYRFIIEDNGIGIKKDYLEHIFEPFSRGDDTRINKIPGTGLGLTIVKTILDMMEGKIETESEYGRGTRFIVTLCMMKKYVLQRTQKEEMVRQIENFKGVRVLLAEDNELNQQIAREMLEFLGARADVVENGSCAVNMVLNNPPFYYDLVFMDVQMPVMNGFEATEKIRASGKEGIGELPIIAMTADAFPEDVKKTRQAGMNGHMAKPIEIDRLRKVLEYCVQWKNKNRRSTENFYYDTSK
ncbi:ATP-binding protein [Ruminococcus sp. OA3]|uniref:hybrid sensor histidine kinase/response regulator n=1 Tax=Ruminococcus sp. OA3 TaxID=2914164 RepID=UPI001F0677A0|nr:ATP-binding protein [Ruminococcus sp. OA3]MCH1981604.1 ATP-binding protein [Ruminococcus sp. OA3]